MTNYYPTVKVETFIVTKHPPTFHCRLTTQLRKRHTDGRYYLQNFVKDYVEQIDDSDDRIKVADRLVSFVNNFHRDVYYSHFLGIVDPDSPFMFFKEDSLQLPEEERLRQKLVK